MQNKRIIVAPLNWGLGHAVRCIPIIKDLLSRNNEVAIASDGESLDLLKSEFPFLIFFEIPSYNVTYPFKSMAANMILQSPKFVKTYFSELKEAEKIAHVFNADVLLSDNRFGFRSSTTYNIYMTHQLRIPSSNFLTGTIATKIHKSLIHKYDECWVPDYKGEKSLSGKLSQEEIAIKTVFLGPLSRMKQQDERIVYDCAIILSGPEPQRTKLEEKLLKKYSNSSLKICLVRGTEKGNSIASSKNIDVFNLVNSEKINQILNTSKDLICRAGYTSIMDLVTLNKAATLIPTPGQYEQEYLAKRLNGKYNFKVLYQKDI